MGKQQMKQKKRLNSEVILTIIVIWITIAFLILLAFTKINRNATKSKMKVPNVEAPQTAGIARERTDLVSCATGPDIQYTNKELLMKKSGLEPNENLVNWNLAEGIGSYVEYSVGNRALDFAGYDFNEVQQVTTKRIKNCLDSSNKSLSQFVLQDSGSQAWQYVCVNHQRITETTLINVLKVLYLEDDYGIPDNVIFQYAFPYSEEGETESSNLTVSDPYQAFDLVCAKGLSDTLYPYSSYVFTDSNGDKQLLIFCGSFDN